MCLMSNVTASTDELALQLPLARWLLYKAFYGKRWKVLFVVGRVSIWASCWWKEELHLDTRALLPLLLFYFCFHRFPLSPGCFSFLVFVVDLTCHTAALWRTPCFSYGAAFWLYHSDAVTRSQLQDENVLMRGSSSNSSVALNVISARY